MTTAPNRAARLARWCVRSAFAPLRWPRLALMGGLILVTAVCAWWHTAGLHRAAGTPLTLWQATDYAYAPFLYLVPQGLLAQVDTLTLPQAIARLTGPLIPLISLFWLMRQRLLLWLARWLARHRARGHSLVIGADASADALARNTSMAGAVVVLVDPSLDAEDDDRWAMLAASGVIGMAPEDALARHAGALAVWQPSEADNIAEAIRLRASPVALDVAEINLRVESAALQHAMLQSPDLMLGARQRLRPHALGAAAIRAALAGPVLAERALAQQQSRVTLCLWGMSDALVWAGEIALRQFWSARLGAPRILWVGSPDAVTLPEPLLGLTCHAAAAYGAGADAPAAQMISPEAAIADAQVTCHLVDYGEADETVAQAFVLAAALRQAHTAVPPVQAILDTARAITPLFDAAALAFLPPITPGVGITLEALCQREADRAAAEIHLAYDREFGGGGTVPASGRWQDLPETYIAANRAAADHRAIKLWDAATSGLAGEALVEALAEAEHKRWCAERLLAGWAPAGDGPRDNDRRLHPDLRPWAELDETAREKDRAAVAFACAGARDRVSRT